MATGDEAGLTKQLNFEEAVHKLMKINLPEGREVREFPLHVVSH
jgi:hypothetical protein